MGCCYDSAALCFCVSVFSLHNQYGFMTALTIISMYVIKYGKPVIFFLTLASPHVMVNKTDRRSKRW